MLWSLGAGGAHVHVRFVDLRRIAALSAGGGLFRWATIFLTNFEQGYFFRQLFVFWGSTGSEKTLSTAAKGGGLYTNS